MSKPLETTRDVEERLAEIRARHVTITPGPWKLCHHLRRGGDATCTCGYRGGVWSGDGEAILLEMGGSPERNGDKVLPERSRAEQLADAEFIANAPDDVTFLLARLDEARRDSARLDWLESTGGYVTRYNAPLNGWEAHWETNAVGANGEYYGATARDAIDAAASLVVGEPHE